MKFIEASNANDLLVKSVKLLKEQGREVTLSTGANSGKCLTIGKAVVKVTDPASGIVTLPGRRNDILAVLVESVWILTGRKGVNPILLALIPRLRNFSDKDDDQGLPEWRGAYSRLIYNNQLEHAFTQLKLDKHTRKAVAMIADPTRDSIPGYIDEIGTIFTRDNICNLGLVFDVVNDKLDLTVLNRSQDVIWGMTNVNITEFTLIQRIMASMLGLEVGNYYVMTTNLHLYHKNKVIDKQCESIVNEESEVNLGYDLYRSLSLNGLYGDNWRQVTANANKFLDKMTKLFVNYENAYEDNFTIRLGKNVDKHLDEIYHLLSVYDKDSIFGFILRLLCNKINLISKDELLRIYDKDYLIQTKVK